jgi:hypothetical protein
MMAPDRLEPVSEPAEMRLLILAQGDSHFCESPMTAQTLGFPY